MEIKLIDANNVKEVQAVFYQVFTVEPWNDQWDDLKQLELYLLDEMDNKSSLSYGLYDQDQLVGFCIGRIKHWYEGIEYWIDEFGVLNQYQGKGTGSLFMKEVEKAIKEQGIKGIVLFTERDIPAYHFYQKNGFKDHDDKVIFTKGLKDE
ncbi:MULTISPECIES: GNAT family N-acetyltransferase [Coprobacillaceae]|uniref:GNAT family N-acetyltransferase n=1 Tax=Coprobacillaceae TaxID=2810280 RepID=UPI000E552A75|nr:MULTISPECIES: GNAT family N-acetyltransferase [Coprobacillaceae]RHM60250.1 GNAT family N-acetyltransferase [Coprobacillus sp. AF33-1AC]RHS93801.1 GNAT family N-acetyltransferase [Erysipelatoclostridium sp. AM42-17]